MKVCFDLQGPFLEKIIDTVEDVLDHHQVLNTFTAYGKFEPKSTINSSSLPAYLINPSYLISLPHEKTSQAMFDWAHQALSSGTHQFTLYDTHPIGTTLYEIDKHHSDYPCMWIRTDYMTPASNKDLKHMLEKLDD